MAYETFDDPPRSQRDGTDVPAGNHPDDLPEHLPEVRPPSVGFIVQLFLIPALIVAAVIGVYWLFGRLATSDQDWRELVVELRSTNPHRSWRAAEGLAWMLAADLNRPGEHDLTRNPEVARALTELFRERLQAGRSKDVLSQQVALAKTLGLLNQPDRVVPPLLEALGGRADYDPEVRKSAIQSIILIANRADEQSKKGRPALQQELLSQPGLLEGLIGLTREEEPVFRQMGAYALGLIPDPHAQERLRVLLADASPETRTNAAIGLARQDVTDGWPVFREMLKSSQPGRPRQPDDVMQLVALDNVLKAVELLAGEWTDPQRQELLALARPIAEDHREANIRVAAHSAVNALEAAK
jgi:hypothetical protein